MTGRLAIAVAFCAAAIMLQDVGFAADAQHKGYLNKSGPPGLRFRPPPKPTVLGLDPLPINFSAPPAMVTQFETAPIRTQEPPLRSPGIVSWTPVVLDRAPPTSAPTNQMAAITNRVQPEVITAEVLVKYFTGARSNRLDAPLSTPVQFQPPTTGLTSTKVPNRGKEANLQ